MKITRNVILDLLPLYAADEISADTRALVEEYLESDPELAKVVRQMTSKNIPADIPVPRSENGSLRTYRKTKRRIFLQTLLLAGAISIVLLTILIFFFFSS
ncbi:MAG: hypothetical protein JXB26_02210 [Candidatus Aminicenantes bacterium]|nr:hypothetical protein [Candidatus Aminicenantes bacterium]